MSRVSWWLAVFGLALALRLAFLFLVDEPIVYGSAHMYFTKALWIAEHPHPLSFILGSDEWRTWGGERSGSWTLAPLYQLFAAAVFGLFGPHLRPLQIVQCILGAATAVMVGSLGRAVAGSRGSWAGAAYALYWPAVTLASTTMTENLHTFLLAASFALLATPTSRVAARAALGGLLLGLSALVRAVSAGFLPIAALWRLRVQDRRDGRLAAALTLGLGAAAILPWTARNILLTGDAVLIESVSFYNLWSDNASVDEARRANQARILKKQETPQGRRAQALRFVWRGVSRNPEGLAEKLWVNFWYFLRPSDLHQLLIVEYPLAAWRHAVALLLADGVLLLVLPLFLVFGLAARPSPARSLLLLWTGYYLFMLVVVFHTEIRYRSALMPFALAGAAGGLEVLRDPEGRRRWAPRAGLGLGGVLILSLLAPYAGAAWRAVESAVRLRTAAAALARGDLSAAQAATWAAADRDPLSARPWLTFGRWLAHAGHTTPALHAYEQAAGRRAYTWTPRLVLPRLLADAGRTEESALALREAHALSWSADPWLALEVAWRDLPPPRTDEILLGRGDYGAVRGFLHPRRDHRWSRRRAWLRLIPTQTAPEYEVTLHMGSPQPSPVSHPAVTVRVPGQAPSRWTLDPEIRPYTLRARPPAAGPLIVELEAPTWCRAGEAAEQGVRVDRMTVSPAI